MEKSISLRQCFKAYISKHQSGKLALSASRSLGRSTLANYENTLRLLESCFCRTNIDLVITSIHTNNRRKYRSEKAKWMTFYNVFLNYLYNDHQAFDNYVGSQIKNIKSVLSWYRSYTGYHLGDLHKLFVTPRETPFTVALSADQLRFLINDEPFHDSLSTSLQIVKDVMVIGCTVSLRVSDLQRLKWCHILNEPTGQYLEIASKKTGMRTRILLPDYVLIAMNRLRSRSVFILPRMSLTKFNRSLKEIGELAGWTYVTPKHRMRRGKPVNIFKDALKDIHYRFCDHLSSHTMRRTAITTMLRFGMDEHVVRGISGHSPGSVEFYKYVKISQDYADEQLQNTFKKLQNIT